MSELEKLTAMENKIEQNNGIPMNGPTNFDWKYTSHVLKQESLVCGHSYELIESKKKKNILNKEMCFYISVLCF